MLSDPFLKRLENRYNEKMKDEQQIRQVPRSRIATFDVFAAGMAKHHVAALLEADVTAGRQKLRELKRGGAKVSFNAWLVKAIAAAVRQHPQAAGFLKGRGKLVVFDEVRVSFLVEKKIGNERVPMPLVIANAGTKTVAEIASGIEASRSGELGAEEIVLNRKTRAYEKLYYLLPGFLRRSFWKMLLRRPKAAFRTMGNVAITSLGMIGRHNGRGYTKSAKRREKVNSFERAGKRRAPHRSRKAKGGAQRVAAVM